MLRLVTLVIALALPPEPPPSPSQAPGPFTDATGRSGIAFTHRQGERVAYLPQLVGPGCALFDLDGDGWLDALLVQGSGQSRLTTAALEAAMGSGPRELRSRVAPPASGPAHTGARLLRNRGDGRFEDVTEASGVAARGWGMGVLAADLDGDGHPDLVTSYYGRHPALWRNQGDGTFTPLAGALDPGRRVRTPWTTGLAALDADSDGLLDVYACGYQDWAPERFVDDPPQVELRGRLQPETVSPYLAPAIPGTLHRNRGGLSFEDVTWRAGVADSAGKGMGAVAFDADGDGWTDLFVANDVTPCALFHNRGDGTFAEIGREAWVAEIRGSMGLAVGDYNHDGELDLFCTHWVEEMHALYHSVMAPRRRAARRPTPAFVERAEAAGIGRLSREDVGWATQFVDVDLDGWEDLVIVNGHTFVDTATGRLLAQPGIVLANRRDGTFVQVRGGPGHALSRPRVGRGAAFGDVDRDGVIDALVMECSGPAALLSGVDPPGVPRRHWIVIAPVGRDSNRDAVGLRVRLEAGGTIQTREVVTGDSYLSSGPRELHFGLGTHVRADRITLRWPRGRTQVLEGVGADRVVRVVEPAGAINRR